MLRSYEKFGFIVLIVIIILFGFANFINLAYGETFNCTPMKFFGYDKETNIRVDIDKHLVVVGGRKYDVLSVEKIPTGGTRYILNEWYSHIFGTLDIFDRGANKEYRYTMLIKRADGKVQRFYAKVYREEKDNDQ